MREHPEIHAAIRERTEYDVVGAYELDAIRWPVLTDALAAFVAARSYRESVAAEVVLYRAFLPVLRRPRHILTPTRKLDVLRRDGRCVRCGSDERLSVDHLFPRSRGGCGQMWNLAALCESCNSSKGQALHPWALWLMIDQAQGIA